MKIFIHGFWDGFIENTDPVNALFFLDFFSKLFETKMELGNIQDSELLLESIFKHDTFVHSKKWKNTFLFSGENRIHPWYKKYDCVLWGKKNSENIINFPQFIPYLSCCNDYPIQKKQITKIPPKKICAIITNPNGTERNWILEKIEEKISIDYGGNYKKNIPIIQEVYNTEAFLEKISEYKCIITMENSRGETYITEKITHGFRAGIIPIYWGSIHVNDYFNKDRFICMNDSDKIHENIDNIIDILQNDDKYLKMVNNPIDQTIRSIDDIINDIRNLLNLSYTNLQRIYTLCNPEFEPMRFDRLNQMFPQIRIEPYNNIFLSPTYKHTITTEIMQKYVKQNLVKTFRINNIGMKKSEISLFLNYKTILEHIYRNNSDGLFIIFESDVIIIPDEISHLSDFINTMYYKKDNWDLIHIGRDKGFTDYFGKSYYNGKLPYRETPNLPDIFIEDITCPTDKYRLIRKYHTRCCDSFLWNYKGIVQFLNYMNQHPYYEIPFDYYMIQFLETHLEFKHYWSMNTFFIQGSNYGIEKSTIQCDNS